MGQLVVLRKVASSTGTDEILRAVGAAARQRNYVIDMIRLT
jgi:hypothetical protein